MSSACSKRGCLSLFGNEVVSAQKSRSKRSLHFVPSVAPGKALNKYLLQDLAFIPYADIIDSEIQYITYVRKILWFILRRCKQLRIEAKC
jgi:hypothetical protein